MQFLFLFMQPQGGDAGGSLMSTIVMFGLIFLIFYFMIIRPQQRRAKEREQMLAAVKKGDKVVIAGGIHGTVMGVEDKTLLVQVAENVKVKVERGSVTNILREAEAVTN